MPRYNDIGAGSADWDYYPHAELPLFDILYDSAYEWRDDNRMHPEGIFPRNDGRDIDHYAPFGILDLRPGVEDQSYYLVNEGYYHGIDRSYYPVDEHYYQDLDGHVYNMRDDWGGYDNYEELMAAPTPAREDHTRWSNRLGTRGHATLTDDDPYTDLASRGHWYPPTGGEFGYFGNRAYGLPGLRPPDEWRRLPRNYFLDRDDYDGWQTFPPPGHGGLDHPFSYRKEIHGDRTLRNAEYDEWPES